MRMGWSHIHIDMPFITIRELRELLNCPFPTLSSAKRDILIDIAAAEQHGQRLTMKQLVILQTGSATTTRRRLKNLIQTGWVVKLPNTQDGRSEVYGLSDILPDPSAELRSTLQAISANFEKRLHLSGGKAKRLSQ